MIYRQGFLECFFSAVSYSLEVVAFRPDVNYSIMFIYVILFFKVLNNMKINAL